MGKGAIFLQFRITPRFHSLYQQNKVLDFFNKKQKQARIIFERESRIGKDTDDFSASDFDNFIPRISAAIFLKQ